MSELIVAIVMAFLGFIVGYIEVKSDYQENCINKYSDMPHNKVEDYCKNLLKFKKEG